jgi:7-carboxy-7-deazaguanine synthase
MRVSEIFYSIQGEGLHQGYPTIFLRLQGCNLRCTWCDTVYAQSKDNGAEFTVSEVLEKISSYNTTRCKRLCITGGEPLTQLKGLSELALVLPDYHVEIQTNGTLKLPDYHGDQLSFNMDLKCPSSGMAGKHIEENLHLLGPDDQLTCVIRDFVDFEYATSIILPLKLYESTNIFFQPVHNKIELATLAGWVMKLGCDLRIGIQLHKLIWGANRRAV